MRFLSGLLARGSDYVFDRLIDLVNNPRAVDVRFAILFGAATVGIYLAPTIAAGLSADDAHRPYLAAFGRATGVGAWGAFFAEAQDASRRGGGYFPLASLPNLFWLGTSTVATMRILQVVAIALNAATFAAFVAFVSRSNGLALLAVGCAAIALQLRLGIDAIMGPLLVQQLLVEFAFVSFLTAVWYQRSGRRIALLLAVASAAAAALVGELGYAVCIGLALLLALDRTEFSQRRLAAILFACIPLVCVAVGIAEGKSPKALPFANEPLTAIASYATSVAHALLAPIPTSYRASGNIVGESVKDSAADWRFWKVPYPGRLGWLATAAITLCVFIGSVTAEKKKVAPALTLPLACATLWVVPALLPTTSAVRLGMAGDAVYLEAFALGALLAIGIETSLARLQRTEARTTAVASIALIAFLFAYGNVRANAFVIARTNSADSGRGLLAPAAAAGLFDNIPLRSTIVVRGFPGFDAGTFGVRDFRFAVFAVSNRLYATASESAVFHGGALCHKLGADCAPSTLTYVINSTIAPRTTGSITALHWTGSSGSVLLSDGGARFARYKSDVVRAQSIERAARFDGQGVALTTTSSQKLDLFATAKRLCGPVAGKRTFEPDTPKTTWGTGFYPPYPAIPFIAANSLPTRLPKAADNRWSYAGSIAHLIVTNEVCTAKALELNAEIYTSVPARIDVRGLANHRAYETSQDGVVISFKIPVKAKRVDVTIETDAPPAHDIYWAARFPDARQYDIHMLVNQPTLTLLASQ